MAKWIFTQQQSGRLSGRRDLRAKLEIVYYETPAELANALVNDEVDALVNMFRGRYDRVYRKTF